MDKIKALVRKLIEDTQRGTVAWGDSPKKNAYQVSLSRFSVVIREASPFDTVGIMPSAFVLEVINSDGIVVDSVTDFALRNSLGALPANVNELENLYKMARRRALGSDEALDEIMNELKGRG